MAIAQKNGDKKIRTAVEEVKYKIEVVENQIKQMKEVDIWKSVYFSYISLYAYLQYPPNFQVPKLEKYDGAGYVDPPLLIRNGINVLVRRK